MPGWDWERRRSYLTYEALRNTVMTVAGYIEQFGDDYGPNKYQSLRQALMQNTGLDFPPNQTTYQNIFRNYKRLYSGLDLFTFENGRITLLPTGEWIADNDPSEEEVYERIINSFTYPNPAFQSYDDWVATGRSLTPMQLIIRCITALEIRDPHGAYLTPQEIATVLYEAYDDIDDAILADAIISYRNNLGAPALLPHYHPTPDDQRQVREILSFMEEMGVIRNNTHNRVMDTSQFSLSTTRRIRTNTQRPRRQTTRTGRTATNPTYEFVEGAIYQENRRSRRRNTQLREHALNHYGCVCEVCRFDYSLYGDIGRSAVDVHHLRPISDRTGNETTTLDDVCVLCASCHRMIHAGGHLHTPEQLRQFIEQFRLRTQ